MLAAPCVAAPVTLYTVPSVRPSTSVAVRVPLATSVASSVTLLASVPPNTVGSLAPVRLMASVWLALAVPSLTVTVKFSLVLVLRASMAASLGAKLQAPLGVVTLRVPWLPVLLMVPSPLAVPPVMT